MLSSQSFVSLARFFFCRLNEFDLEQQKICRFSHVLKLTTSSTITTRAFSDLAVSLLSSFVKFAAGFLDVKRTSEQKTVIYSLSVQMLLLWSISRIYLVCFSS